MSYADELISGAISYLDEQRRKEEYRLNPTLWAKEYLGVDLWWKQSEIANALVHNKNVAVKAGHSVGKSWSAGLLICWWVDVHPTNDVFVATTAPSTAQINAIVWREVRKFHALAKQRFDDGLVDHPLPGYITSDAHWRLPGGVEIGYGRKPPEGADGKIGDAFQGIHADYVLAIGDEATGLPGELIDSLGNITSNETSRRLLLANPTNPMSAFADIFKNDTGVWDLHTISVLDSPNFHGGGECECHPSDVLGLGFPLETAKALVDKSYVEDKEREYAAKGGRDSPQFKARVLGEFAFDMGPTLFTETDIATALDAEIMPDPAILPVIGVDVARFGDDSSVAYIGFSDGEGGLKVRLLDHWEKSSGTDTARRIHQLAVDNSVREVRIDGAGLGGPIADQVRELSGGRYLLIEMIGGAASPNRQRWGNARAFWYDSARDRVASGKIGLDLADRRLQEELLGMEYKIRGTGLGALMMESKDDMKKRGVKSPDFADAFIYTCADLSAVTGDGINALKPGTRVALDPWSMLERSRGGRGYPV